MHVPTETIVHIKGLSVLAYVGLHAPERNEPQKLYIDIDCVLRNAVVARENLASSVDYVPIAEAVRKICVSTRRKLIETLAEEISVVCFEQPQTHTVRIRICKPYKMPDCESVGVTRVFTRKEKV